MSPSPIGYNSNVHIFRLIVAIQLVVEAYKLGRRYLALILDL
jgi:hypothetical protein